MESILLLSQLKKYIFDFWKKNIFGVSKKILVWKMVKNWKTLNLKPASRAHFSAKHIEIQNQYYFHQNLEMVFRIFWKSHFWSLQKFFFTKNGPNWVFWNLCRTQRPHFSAKNLEIQNQCYFYQNLEMVFWIFWKSHFWSLQKKFSPKNGKIGPKIDQNGC